MYKIAVVGGRNFINEQLLNNVLDSINPRPQQIISGGAKGADTLAKKYADNNNISCVVIPARWNIYGKPAGAIRNKEIVKLSNIVIAFWDGESRGTKITIDLARQYEKKLIIYRY